MAVRVWREWLAASLVLVLGACSGKSGQRGDETMGMGTGGAVGPAGSAGMLPMKMYPGKVTEPMGGYSMVGTAGEAPSEGARAGFGGAPSAGAPAELAGAAGADDGPNIVVTAPGDHMVHESYGTVQLQVRLTTQPQLDVRVDLVSSDPAHAVVYPLSLTFTPDNWATQTAIVVGVRDAVADSGNTVTIKTLPAVTGDKAYLGIDAADVDVFVIDETTADIVVGPVTGGVTSESGAFTTFNIVLTSQPTATVTIPLTSTDPGEGTVANVVVFSPSEWSTPHQVTVKGVDDLLSDGVQTYDILTGPAVSLDEHYAGVDAADVHLSNTDNE